ncbi:MAG: HAMP domain-containing sensor histidine kinase [Acidobacteriota bacterium]
MPSSMHRSLQKAFWTFGGVLVMVYALLHGQLSNWQEDQLLLRQIRLELESYLSRHPEVLTGAAAPPMTSRFLSIHLGADALPSQLAEKVAPLPPGIHEINRGPMEGEDYFIAVRLTEKPGTKLYLIFDVRRFEDVEWWHTQMPVLFGACVVVFSIGLIWASRYSRAVLEPLTGLAETVGQEPRPADLAEALSRRRDPAELAQLSRALEGSMKTIGELVHREREFTRNASHELRTPLAVIRGAAELLAYEELSEPAARRLLRIQRSVQQMEELIETFLWLAREHPGASDALVEVAPLVHRIVEGHRHLLGSRPVDVVVEVDPELEMAVHAPILAVVLANLVKNAFYSTQEGSVTIECSGDLLTVADTGPGFDVNEPGEHRDRSTHGFGLNIVRDLCERSAWDFRLRARVPRGITATVSFEGEASSRE